MTEDQEALDTYEADAQRAAEEAPLNREEIETFLDGMEYGESRRAEPNPHVNEAAQIIRNSFDAPAYQDKNPSEVMDDLLKRADDPAAALTSKRSEALRGLLHEFYSYTPAEARDEIRYFRKQNKPLKSNELANYAGALGGNEDISPARQKALNLVQNVANAPAMKEKSGAEIVDMLAKRNADPSRASGLTAHERGEFALLLVELESTKPIAVRDALKARDEAQRKAEEAQEQHEMAEGARDVIDETAQPSSKTPERERLDAMLGKIGTVAEGTAHIHMDLAPGLQVKTAVYPRATHSGLQTFGDGDTGDRNAMHFYLKDELFLPKTEQESSNKKQPDDLIELVAFVPATEDTYKTITKEVPKRGWAGRRGQTELVETEVHDTKPIERTNELTGQTEKVVYFDYKFDPSLSYDISQQHDRNIKYQETRGGRGGGELNTRIALPESVANELKILVSGRDLAGNEVQGATPDPAFAREVVAQIVQQQGGLTPEAWKESRPPYERVNGDQNSLYVCEPTTEEDQQRNGYGGGFIAHKVQAPIRSYKDSEPKTA